MSSADLKSKVRLLCFIPTTPRNLPNKATAVKETWASRCDVTLFFSSETNSAFPTIGLPEAGEGMATLSAKTMAAFSYIHQHHLQDADWFLKADDDTYIIVENLKYLLSHYNSTDPVYLGHHFKKYTENGYMSGGGGYVLSKEAVIRLATSGQHDGGDTCRPRKGSAEDATIGKCLEKLDVKPASSVDIKGRESFHPFNLATHIFGQFPEWYKDYAKHNIKQVTTLLLCVITK